MKQYIIVPMIALGLSACAVNPPTQPQIVYVPQVAPSPGPSNPVDPIPLAPVPEVRDYHVDGSGYKDLKWGDSIHEVVRKTGGTLDRGQVTRQPVVFYHDQMFGYDFLVGAYFEGNGLDSVILTTYVPIGDSGPKELTKKFVQAYGGADKTDKKARGITLYWQLPEGLLFLGLRYDDETLKHRESILHVGWTRLDSLARLEVKSY